MYRVSTLGNIKKEIIIAFKNAATTGHEANYCENIKNFTDHLI
jgi:hypothetical protein